MMDEPFLRDSGQRSGTVSMKIQDLARVNTDSDIGGSVPRLTSRGSGYEKRAVV